MNSTVRSEWTRRMSSKRWITSVSTYGALDRKSTNATRPAHHVAVRARGRPNRSWASANGTRARRAFQVIHRLCCNSTSAACVRMAPEWRTRVVRADRAGSASRGDVTPATVGGHGSKIGGGSPRNTGLIPDIWALFGHGAETAAGGQYRGARRVERERGDRPVGRRVLDRDHRRRLAVVCRLRVSG